MAEENPMDRWQLQDTGNVAKQWQLQESSQPLNDEWQVYEDNAGITPWQPVEYERGAGQRGWLLPTLVILGLLVAIGYVGWLAYNRLGLSGLVGLNDPPIIEETGQLPPTGAEETDIGVTGDQVTPIIADTPVPPTPTVAPPPPTLTPAPTPTAVMIEQKLATVAHPYGVNARPEPSVQSEVLRIIPEGERGIVLEERDEWLQIQLPDDGQVWVSSQFMDISTELVEDTSNVQPELGDASVKITAPAGLNARSAPVDEADVLEYLLADTVVTALVYSDDQQWIMVELEDGRMAWVFAEFVELTGRIGIGLPEAQEEQLAEPEINDETPGNDTGDDTGNDQVQSENGVASDSVTASFPAGDSTAQDVVTTGVEVEPPFSNVIPIDSPSVIIERAEGVNSRAADNVTSEEVLLLPQGSVIPILGKNEAGDWLQLGLPDGRQGWVFAQAVATNQDIDTLPVIEQGTTAITEDATEEDVTEEGATSEDATETPDSDGSADADNENIESEDIDSDAAEAIESNASARTLLAIYPSPSNLQRPLDVVLNGGELAVIGRSGDGLWLQINWEKGDDPGWVSAAGVELTVEVESLPVVE